MPNKKKLLLALWDWAVIAAGCGIHAFAFNCFFYANRFAMGGFTGFAQILNRLSADRIPVGVTVFVMNLPLILVAAKKQGMKLLIATVITITLSSLLIDGFAAAYSFAPMEDPLLACISGSILMGAALGIMIRRGATTGGTELLARLLKYRFRYMSIGRLCLIIDLTVVGLYALTFGEWINALYGVVAMFISTRVMDMMVYGSWSGKLAMIISDRSQAITKRLLDMQLGVTILEGKGAWSGKHKTVILCVFKKQLIAAIKAAATEEDPNAFVIVSEAHEVLGEGFGEYSEDSL